MYRLLVLIFCVTVSTSYADAIYKSVDAEGNVISSATPPANSKNVESLEPAAEASDDQVRAALERQQRLQAYVDESVSERTRRKTAKQRTRLSSPSMDNILPNLPPLAGQ